MTLPIISDSHGYGRRIGSIFERLAAINERPDGMIFLGDGAREIVMNTPEDIKLYSVLGNCDGLCDIYDNDGEIVPLERLEVIGGVRILMMHGHRYFVKHGLSEAIFRANNLSADILLFGHTHLPVYKMMRAGEEISGEPLKKDLHIFNPGALADRSFGLLTVKNGKILLSHGKI